MFRCHLHREIDETSEENVPFRENGALLIGYWLPNWFVRDL